VIGACENPSGCDLDPLKIVLARSLSAALFFLPAVDVLRARYMADCELAADRQAIVRWVPAA
jgi:hypothetical protein